MDRPEYDDLLRHLVRIVAHQDTINSDLRTCIQELQGIAGDTRTTLARVETLLARMIRQQDNGREA